jgi:hypothetical protein
MVHLHYRDNCEPHIFKSSLIAWENEGGIDVRAVALIWYVSTYLVEKPTITYPFRTQTLKEDNNIKTSLK